MEEKEIRFHKIISDPENLSKFYSAALRKYVLSNQSELIQSAPVKKPAMQSKENNSSQGNPIDVVIIVAVPDEKDGVNSAFGVSKNDTRNLDLLDKYGFGYNEFEQDGLRIALLIQPSMGMTQSASLATRAILAFKPKLIAMVGICGGRKEKTNLGDIIIASSVYDYTAGKHYVDRFGPRPQSYPFDTRMSEYIASTVIDNHELIGKIYDGYYGSKPGQQIHVHFKPLASGSAVVDDPEIIKEASKAQDDLAGIDMEAYALAVAANILRTKWIVIKSVQDFADGEKGKTETAVRSFASYASAKLLQLILNDLSMYL